MFAYNNNQINYVKLAILCALHVKKYMKHNSVTLITDAGTEAYMTAEMPLHKKAFDNVVITNVEHRPNIRVNHDSPYHTFNSQFTNHNKHQIYEYSPYDKTLLIDIDFMIANNMLDMVFETNYELAMYSSAMDLRSTLPHPNEVRLHPGGVNMWWSTVIYFEKTPYAKMLFDMWGHIRDNWDFYKLRYGFPGHMFRTDYAVSIAIHIMNGMFENDMVHTLPGDFMRYQDQKDDILHIHDSNDIVYLSNDKREHWKDIPVRLLDENVHVMNKRSIERHYNRWLETVK
jgi:hypothetical protein